MATKKEKAGAVGRPIRHEKLSVEVFQGDRGLTAEQAKQLLGWQEESEAVKFGQDYLLVDRRGLKVRATNNTKNRPFDVQNCRALSQSMLLKQWRLNGEPLIIGQTDEVLDGQHTLVALVLAEQARLGYRDGKMDEGQKGHWRKVWDGPVRID